MVVFDTDVLIDAMNGKRKALDVIGRHQGEKAALTIFNKYELLNGRRFVSRPAIEEFVNDMIVYDAGTKEIEAASDIYLRLSEAGQMIDELDILIAGVVLANGEKLVTFDRHFKSIKDQSIIVLDG